MRFISTVKNSIKLFILILIIFSLTSCNANIATKEDKVLNERVKKEIVSQINTYYDEMGLFIGRSLDSLGASNESKKKISALSTYLFKHGYQVTRVSEPQLLKFEDPYAIYQVTIKVKYPEDFQAEYSIQRKLEEVMMEKIWVNPENRLIVKIESKDEFLYARTIQ
jgi:hypothetical protein